MARTNYQRGYETERKIIGILKEDGFLTMRAAGSHGKIDVLGMRKDKLLAIQSKRTKKFTKSQYNQEIKEIQAIIEEYDLPYLDFEFWIWEDRKGFRKYKVTADSVEEI